MEEEIMVMVIGYYNEERYQVHVKGSDSDSHPCVHQAGNSRHGSQVYIARDSDTFKPQNVECLDTMREMCLATCTEVAQQQGFAVGEMVYDPQGDHMEQIFMDHAMDLNEAMHCIGESELTAPYWPNA
jgi:hypothetical protein